MGVAASVIDRAEVYECAHSSITLVAWWTGRTVVRSRCVDTLNRWSHRTTAIIYLTFIDIFTNVSISLPACRTGPAVEGAQGVETRHKR